MSDHRSDTTANPGPLGLLGFGMTTVLLNLHNVDLIPLDSMILAMGIFYGGIAQIIAGMMEWRKGNTFGTTAFISYGFFWMTLVALILLPKTGLNVTAAGKDFSMPAFFVMWGLLTLTLFIASLRHNRATRVIFSSLTVLFFMLAACDYTGNHALEFAAGCVGLFSGASAIYAAFAQILNETYGKVILPV